MIDELNQQKVLVTGGAGFVGSHLVDRLVSDGAVVTVADNFITGKKANLEHHSSNDNLTIIEADVTQKVESYTKDKFEYVFHLASPASPKDFEMIPVETYMPNSMGTHNLLEYAVKNEARFLYTSTSEAYGDPQEHPQKETYWGHVNPNGIRSPYDVSKRFGEMVTMTHVRKYEVDARIVRIFNTYGPRMNRDDGRVIPTFIDQALKNNPMTIHGNGSQTRSFCYVTDLVEYICRAMTHEKARGEVINIGNVEEYSVSEVAEVIKRLTNSSSENKFTSRPEDDPTNRRPDITKAKELLEYEPQVSFEDGLRETIEYFERMKANPLAS